MVSDTRVGDVRGDEGFYHYRQYRLSTWPEGERWTTSFRLLIDGEPPTDVEQRRAFAAEIQPLRVQDRRCSRRCVDTHLG